MMARRAWHQAGSIGAAALLCGLAATVAEAQEQAQEQTPTFVLPDIEVIGVSPIAGTGVDVRAVPRAVEVIDSGEAQDRLQPFTMTHMLEQSLSSVNAFDVQNNPYQKNITYRGFTASPLLGESQGIAVYQNGVRVNEPFGDVVQWDLVPENAIQRIELMSSNPVFGLNAQGGSLAMRMKDGFSFQGVSAEAFGGYFGRGGVNFEFGASNETAAVYFAADKQHDPGWRNRSRSDLDRLYLDAAYQDERLGARFNFVRADNFLNGNGLSPVELLNENRRAVFTWPDRTINDLIFGTAEGSYQISDTVSIQTNFYFRRMIRETFNGDEVEAESCGEVDNVSNATIAADPALAALVGAEGNNAALAIQANGGVSADGGAVDFICEEGEVEGESGELEIILDQNGLPIQNFAPFYGAANTSATITKGFGFTTQANIDEQLFGQDNNFVIGVSYDQGLTEFHNESFLRLLTLDRTVEPFSGGPDPINFAVLEIEFDDANDNDVIDAGEIDEIEFGPGELLPSRLKARNRYAGGFFSNTFYATDDLAFTLGGRFNYALIELVDEFDSFVDITRDESLNGTHRFARFNPSGGVAYTFSDWNTTYYFSYAENNRAPTPAELTCADPNSPCRLPNAFVADPPLEQVVSRTFETGLRGRMPDSWLGGVTTLDWNLGAFSTSNEDDIIFISASQVSLGAGFFQNVKKTKRQGLEIGLSGRAGRVGWFADYSYIEATFEDAFAVASPNHPLADGNGEIFVQPGDNIPGVPEHNFRAGVDVSVLPNWVVGANLLASSGVYLRGDEANLLERTDPYAVVNLQTSYALADWIEVFGRIDNVFDTEYETFGVLGETGDEVPIFELPGGITDPRFLSPGHPFAAFVGVRVRLN